MYGLEKEKKPFQFDLEVELKKDGKKAKETLDKVEHRINEVKNEIRKGHKSKELDDMGILLQGYNALKKVLQKVIQS